MFEDATKAHHIFTKTNLESIGTLQIFMIPVVAFVTVLIYFTFFENLVLYFCMIYFKNKFIETYFTNLFPYTLILNFKLPQTNLRPPLVGIRHKY